MNRHSFLRVLSGLLICSAASVAVSQPSPGEPSRILLTWDDEPSRSQAVSWRTDAITSQAFGQIAPALPGPKLSAQAATVTAESETVETTTGVTVSYHRVRFAGLKPKTKYAYRVGNGSVWSEWNHFITASDQPEPFSFLYVGDAQNDVKSLWSRVIRDAFRQGSQARFILHAGDLINRANQDWEWGEWFEAAGWINRVVPAIAVPGNHEYYRAPGSNTSPTLSLFWRPQFEFPKNGPPGLEETVYYLDHQGVRIVALNSNERQAEQSVWLEKVLTDNPNRWTILTFHHPVYSAAPKRDNPHIRAAWMPLIDKYGVDLVLQGHDHNYTRSKKLSGGTVVGQTGKGSVYVVSVSGPKMYNITSDTEHLMSHMGENLQLYQLITVDNNRLMYEARTASGELYDAFELRKAPGGNALIEQGPRAARRSESEAEPVLAPAGSGGVK